jgi:protein phosphatase
MVRFAGKSDKGLMRRQNEDAYCVIGGAGDGPLVLAVADGMGGHRAGRVASQMAIEAIQESIAEEPLKSGDHSAITDRLLRIVQRANENIYKKALADPECEGMGTTLVLAVAAEKSLLLAHVGDSCAYCFRDGTFRKITIDHTYVEELVRIGTLTREEARIHPKRNYITKAVGCAGWVDADIYEVDIRAGDRVLLCTDGLSKMLTEPEILEAVYASDNPELICGSLIELSNLRGGDDNITVILLINVDEV